MDEKTIARFWSKVDKSAGPDGCWTWTAAKFRDGYGYFKTGGKGRRAHRVAWEASALGDLGGMCVCHRCDVPLCVNPAHLFVGTNADNMADRRIKGRYAPQRGESNRNSKLTEEQVSAIKADRAGAGMTYSELGAKYGVHRATVHLIIAGKNWAHTKEDA